MTGYTHLDAGSVTLCLVRDAAVARLLVLACNVCTGVSCLVHLFNSVHHGGKHLCKVHMHLQHHGGEMAAAGYIV